MVEEALLVWAGNAPSLLFCCATKTALKNKIYFTLYVFTLQS